MKRAYQELTADERKAKADDESFFDLPDGPLRRELREWVLHKRTPLSDRGRAWIVERGLDCCA